MPQMPKAESLRAQMQANKRGDRNKLGGRTELSVRRILHGTNSYHTFTNGTKVAGELTHEDRGPVE